MNKKGMTGIQRGQAITFRLPSDTPDHILMKLQKLKETEKRNFSSKIAEFVVEGVNNSLTSERETITIPLPKQLTKEQRSWLKHTHSEALIGNVIHHLLADPIRATSVLATLNSNSLDIDEALYLQEMEKKSTDKGLEVAIESHDEIETDSNVDDFEDVMMNFDWEMARKEQASSIEDSSENEEEEEDPLDDFLSRMNK
ncbi:hypothetical protein [Lederbergia lenta]|uniref:Uncharacterized protein n=1 Tax=Lederbergia lenta TaxID=1467 RepID=A0A2X4WH81_LEDLE|nr:hypothetical protein [Lederbergia lenta]MCM3112268.1 hypothetical protein [Lederbergia lenta]MEC2323435.1 hypothetical protein [Lederbergia lenta]SQI63406.1 Uncharacterised protein [Lederbergia lenta]